MRQLTTMARVESSTFDFVSAPVVPRLRVGKLCVAIQGATPAEMWERAGGAQETKFVEFRLDALPKPASALPGLKEFLAGHRDVTAIATCRRKQFGGHFVGSLTAELELLAKAAEAGCSIVDLEVESAEEAKRPRSWPSFGPHCGRPARRCWSASTTLPGPRDWSRRLNESRPSSRIL